MINNFISISPTRKLGVVYNKNEEHSIGPSTIDMNVGEKCKIVL